MMRTGGADRLGILASSLCAAHCIAGAAIVGGSGALALISDERVELVLLTLVAVIAAFALGTGYRRHRDVRPSCLAAVALCGFVLARFDLVEHELAEVAISAVATAVLIAAHLLNLRLLRRTAACC